MKLIFELVKETFVARLRDDRIRYVVKTKGEKESYSSNRRISSSRRIWLNLCIINRIQELVNVLQIEIETTD